MASMTSCALEIPLIAYSDEITEMKDGSVFATCMGDQMAYKVEAKTASNDTFYQREEQEPFSIRTRYHENI